MSAEKETAVSAPEFDDPRVLPKKQKQKTLSPKKALNHQQLGVLKGTLKGPPSPKSLTKPPQKARQKTPLVGAQKVEIQQPQSPKSNVEGIGALLLMI